MHLLRVMGLSVLHFALAVGTGLIAEGWDLDRLRSRTPWSRGAGVAHDILMFPHDLFLRAIPNHWLWGGSFWIPLALYGNSLLWGVMLYALWRAWTRRRTIGSGGRVP